MSRNPLFAELKQKQSRYKVRDPNSNVASTVPTSSYLHNYDKIQKKRAPPPHRKGINPNSKPFGNQQQKSNHNPIQFRKKQMKNEGNKNNPQYRKKHSPMNPGGSHHRSTINRDRSTLKDPRPPPRGFKSKGSRPQTILKEGVRPPPVKPDFQQLYIQFRNGNVAIPRKKRSNMKKVKKIEEKEDERKLFEKHDPGTSFSNDVKESFFIFDKNGDGIIDKNIVVQLINEIDHERKKEMLKMINSVNEINYSLYQKLFKEFLTLPYSRSELEQFLYELHPDEDNSFELNDFKTALTQMSKNDKSGIKESEIDEICNGIAENGRISVKSLGMEMGE